MQKGRLLDKGAQAEIYEWAPGQVLKLFRPGASQAWVESEARNTHGVHELGLPVPDALQVVEVDGRRGIVMEYIDGKAMDYHILRRPWTAPAYAHRMAELHAAVHRHSVDGPAQVTQRLRRSITRSTVLAKPLKAWALGQIDRIPDGRTLLHFDFHPKNVLVSGRSLYIIDWDNLCVGDPAADVARTCLLVITGRYHVAGAVMRGAVAVIGELFRREYIRRYLEITGCSAASVDAWLPLVAAARTVEGFPDEIPVLERIVRRAAEKR